METDYQKILDCISPSMTNRQEWVQVGMALKYEGCPFEMFDRWSAGDVRPGQYKGTEKTLKVWESFRNSGSGTVTGATLTQMARDQGHDPFPVISGFFDWNDDVTSDGEEPLVRKKEVTPRFNVAKKPVFQVIDYLETMFQEDDHINIITTSFTDEEGKRKPRGAGLISITVGEYVRDLRKAADSPEFFDEVFGSYDHEAGVWVRINPVTGHLGEGQKAVSDKNVTRYENALIECDEYSIDEQLRIIKEIGLPYKALVYSGGKSVHAIIKVDANSLADYKEKVGWLHQYCIANGLPVDTQNSNPSRMSRLPGVERGHQKQLLLETQKPQSFDDFRKAAQAAEDSKSLEIEGFDEICGDLPDMAPEIIHGILRKGHKMLISGPSKSGKSFALIGLAIAAAEGRDWMGFHVEQGRVLYINLEIDRPSFLHRISDIYNRLGWPVDHPKNLQIMNLRGQAEPLDKLGPKLEALVRRRHFDLVIIDPIYKVITGDENSASDMGSFCNLFDRLAKAGECAVAYCHHHSKGSQAQKSAIDRASGSGVFARDPDAIIDMTEIGFTDLDREELKARLLERVSDSYLHESGQWERCEKTHPEQLHDRLRKREMVEADFKYHPEKRQQFMDELESAEKLGDSSAYRISFTLREFASPGDRNVLFDYPIHVTDPTGYLESLYLAGDNSVETMNKKKAEKVKKRADKKREWYDQERAAGHMIGISEMVERFSCSPNTVKSWVNKQDDLKRENGWIVKNNEIAPPKKGRGKTINHEIDD